MITAFFRTIILYLIIIFGLRLMGKRQIGELEPAELVLTMMLSDLATVPMQDFGVPLLAGVVPIFTLLSLSLLLSLLSLKNLRLRAVVCGTPTLLIENGKLHQNAMRRNRFTLDELLENLRMQGILDLESVQYAILENSGQLSVLLYPDEQPLTPRSLREKSTAPPRLPIPLINDGRVLRRNLTRAGKSDDWLRKTLADYGLHAPEEAFFLSVGSAGRVLCIPKEDAN